MALNPTKLEQAEFSRIVFFVVPEPGVTINMLLDPKYWVHVASKLKPRSRIEVLAADNSYFAELLVLASDKTWASVTPLRYIDLTGKLQKVKPPKDDSDSDEFKTDRHYVDYVTGSSRGRVILKEGKVVVKDGFASKKAAAEWMVEHEKSLDAQQAAAAQNLME